MTFTYGDVVMTPHGEGMIITKDICSDGDTQVWTGRWGVLHDVYPSDKPKGMYKDDILYYTPHELTIQGLISMNDIRLHIKGESFWAYQYPDLPPNQAEVNNHLLTSEYKYGDRVEFDENRKVTRLIKTRQEVIDEQCMLD